MNTEVETRKKKGIVVIFAFLVAVYVMMRSRKQSDLYVGDEEYDCYGTSTRKRYTFLLLVAALFQVGMRLKNDGGVSASISNMIQYVNEKRNLR
ncbi:hypothetical protein ACE41A_05890 [Bacillus cytotoxicus]|uniref:hypothetical protein n=1 Tax=Bacillus cytotoxicus TaxID=580165 RepID=UPI00244D0CC1|nr:hypothetical protein [Bacillus cytotoxicus]MDH2879786.1 hypothetical protein [Bacillus cytotoxicus]